MSEKTMNQDAVRTAEQIRAKLETRPACVTVGDLAPNENSATVALEIAQALATLENSAVLLIELNHKNKLLTFERTPGATSNIPSIPLQQLTDRLETNAFPEIATKLYYSFLETGPADENAFDTMLSPEALELIERAKAQYPLTIIHTPNYSTKQGYAIMAKSDCILLSLTKGQCSLNEISEFTESCKRASPAPVLAILCNSAADQNLSFFQRVIKGISGRFEGL